MKKKLLITVGAGASINFGMPSVNDVDGLFNKWASENYSLANGSGNLYFYVKDSIDSYYNKNPKPLLRSQVNFEETLYQIMQVGSALGDTTFCNPLNALFTINKLPQVNYFRREIRDVDGHLLTSLASYLTDNLVMEFITRCESLPTTKVNEILVLRNFIDILGRYFDIGIITLNYDNVFTTAKPDLKTGFNKGLFDRESVFKSIDWNFIYHLHGSIHFSLETHRNNLHEITWKPKPQVGHGSQSSGRSNIESMEGIPSLRSPIIVGYGKSNQILRTPFFTYFSQIERLVNEADSFLFLGYGFNDLHLNSMFRSIRDRPRPVTIIDYANDDQDCLEFRNDNWSHNLLKTIPTNQSDMSCEGRQPSAALISDLKDTKSFEVSTNPNYPLAVWYDGMLSACQHADKVIAKLK